MGAVENASRVNGIAAKFGSFVGYGGANVSLIPDRPTRRSGVVVAVEPLGTIGEPVREQGSRIVGGI
jgi:hypothetical protein